MNSNLEEFKQSIQKLSPAAKEVLRELHITEKLSSYVSSQSPLGKFVIVMPAEDVSKKMHKLSKEEITARLLKTSLAATRIQNWYRNEVERIKKSRYLRLGRIMRQISVQNIRNKVEVAVRAKYDKFLKIKKMVIQKKQHRLEREQMELALKTLAKAVWNGYLRRAGFAMYMIKEFADACSFNASMMSKSKKSEVGSSIKDFLKNMKSATGGEDGAMDVGERRIPKKVMNSKFIDHMHALIFQNFRGIGRKEGSLKMAEEFNKFVLRAKAYYTLINYYNCRL